MNALCKGTPHTRHEVIHKVDVPDKPLLIHEVGTCCKCGTQKHYERMLDLGSFMGSLESNPLVSHWSGYSR
jgi:hypothetical protein